MKSQLSYNNLRTDFGDVPARAVVGSLVGELRPLMLCSIAKNKEQRTFFA